MQQPGPLLPAERQDRGALPDQPGDEPGQRLESLLSRARLDQAHPRRPGQRPGRRAAREDVSPLSCPGQQSAGLHRSAVGRRQRHGHRAGLQEAVAEDAGAEQEQEEGCAAAGQAQGAHLQPEHRGYSGGAVGARLEYDRR